MQSDTWGLTAKEAAGAHGSRPGDRDGPAVNGVRTRGASQRPLVPTSSILACASLLHRQQHTGCFLFSCQDFKFKLCYRVGDSWTPGNQWCVGVARLWAAPRPWASAPLGATCPHAPHTVPSHLQLPVSPISSPPRGLLAVCTVRSSAAVMAAEPERHPQIHSRPSPHRAPVD